MKVKVLRPLHPRKNFFAENCRIGIDLHLHTLHYSRQTGGQEGVRGDLNTVRGSISSWWKGQRVCPSESIRPQSRSLA